MVTLTPLTLDEALVHLAERPVRIFAGGTDVLAAAGERPMIGPLLDVTRLEGLARVERTPDGGWRIGAAVTWSTLAREPLPAAFDALKCAARQLGSVQIQNTATLVGNLCNASPAADGVPALLVLDAAVEVARVGARRVIPLADLILSPRRTCLVSGEMVSAILVPPQPPSAASAFQKLGARRHLVISIASVAALVALDATGRIIAARVAVGACSPAPARLPTLEAALLGERVEAIGGLVADEHLAALSPIDDVRAPAAYRRDAVRVLVARALAEAVAPREAAA
ncbi:FAD binding domain-containing protein [Acuticoccus sp.]|uniref:FAD binding domain-containing protein n=1 Tax=Acuticoccus sp. TaxID=1904378 RepID=UPI003B51A88E